MVMFAKIAIICQLNVIFLTRTQLSAHQIENENDERRWCRRKCSDCVLGLLRNLHFCLLFRV